jgi:hypothetical protein
MELEKAARNSLYLTAHKPMKLISILSLGGWHIFFNFTKDTILFGFSLRFKDNPLLKRAAFWEAAS